jgi:hypothetical protein
MEAMRSMADAVTMSEAAHMARDELVNLGIAFFT